MAERRGRCGHAGCLCDGFVKNRGMPGICARCRHRLAEHSTEVESQEDRTARKEAEAEQARKHLLEHIEKAKNSRGEARAARWREMLPPADEEWQTLTLRKTDERTRLVDVDGASSEFQQISLRKTATTQPVADRSAPKAFSSPRPPSGATSSVPMEPTAPREAGPEAAAFSRFLDATDIVSMQQALNECCEASGLLPYTNDRYPDLKERLVRQLNYADRQIFETLDAKLVRPPSQDASSLRVAVVGGGPVGLRTALELALCGAKVWVIEKRQHFNRLNILHLWEWVCTDLLNLGATGADLMGRSFFHIGTCQLQLLLAQAFLLLGGQLLTCCEYHGVEKAPPDATAIHERGEETFDVSDSGGSSRSTRTQHLWRVRFVMAGAEEPTLLPVHALVAAGGAHDPVLQDMGFATAELKGKEALGVVAHFQSSGKKSQALEEFSWASQFNKPMFAQLAAEGIAVENVVHYEGATHYFVCTPSRESLMANGVLPEEGAFDKPDAEALRAFVRRLATFF